MKPLLLATVFYCSSITPFFIIMTLFKQIRKYKKQTEISPSLNSIPADLASNHFYPPFLLVDFSCILLFSPQQCQSHHQFMRKSDLFLDDKLHLHGLTSPPLCRWHPNLSCSIL